MVPRLCDRHAAARLTRRHLKVLLVDLGYAVNPFIVLQVLVARGLGGVLLLHVRLDLLGDRVRGGAPDLDDVGTRELVH